MAGMALAWSQRLQIQSQESERKSRNYAKSAERALASMQALKQDRSNLIFHTTADGLNIAHE